MRLSFLFIFALIIQISASCQTDTNVVPIAAYWDTGDVYNFRITKLKQTWQGKKLTQNDSTQYLARFQVISSDTASYTIRWSFKNPLLESFRLPDNSRTRLSKYENMEVNYKTDEFGAFTGVENWREISTMINDLIHEVISLKSTESESDTNEFNKALEPVISVYNSRRGIEQLLVKELLMFHFPYGKAYTRGKVYNYTEKLPVMMNTGPAIGNGIIFIRQVNMHDHRCEVVQRLAILPDSAKSFMRQYFIDLGMKPEAIGMSIAASRLEINDDNIYDFYYQPGIPAKITVTRETLIDILEDKIKQFDQTIIEKTEN